jgi:hypothetical protein
VDKYTAAVLISAAFLVVALTAYGLWLVAHV